LRAGGISALPGIFAISIQGFSSRASVRTIRCAFERELAGSDARALRAEHAVAVRVAQFQAVHADAEEALTWMAPIRRSPWMAVRASFAT